MPGQFVWTLENYSLVKHYLLTGKKPKGISESKFRRLKSKIQTEKGIVTIEKGKLYRIRENGDKMLILPEKRDVREKILLKYYENPETTCHDAYQFYLRLSESFEGFSKYEVVDFLSKQRAHQMTKLKKPKNQ